MLLEAVPGNFIVRRLFFLFALACSIFESVEMFEVVLKWYRLL